MNLLQMSISASFLVILIFVVRAIAINRMPKTMFTVLWGVALVRLLIPWSFPSKYGISGIINPIIREFFLHNADPMMIDKVPGKTIIKNSAYFTEVLKPSQAIPATFIWIAGIVLFAALFAVSFCKWYREIRTALPVKENDLINKWLSEQKIKRKVRILMSDKITTPLTYGILKPRIILPKSMDFKNGPQLRYILTHEFIHIKSFDTLWKLLLSSAVCVHWFNPFAWTMYFLMNRDLEISCDEKVIRLFGERARSSYALALINMAETRSGFAPMHSSFSKSSIEERIVSVMKFRKASVISMVLAILLVAGSTSVFAKATVNILHLYGVVKTENGNYTFDLDKNGTITVRDDAGKVVSTTNADSSGEAVLIDENGDVISKIMLIKPEPGNQGEKKVRVMGSSVISADRNGHLPNYQFEINNDDTVTVKDEDGSIIGSGKADENGTAVLTNNAGEQIGAIDVKDKSVIRFSINIREPL